jgi:phosphoribosylaminoimidazole-succinocarboxamide synthase
MIAPAVIREALAHPLDQIELPALGPRHSGKVRDSYRCGERRLLVTTDRVSAFDRVIGWVPLKGQLLNQLSAWWFAQTRDLVANHLLGVPDPNVSIVREAQPLPVEVIVRGHITGVTSTSLWTLYQQGVARPYGLDLPPGLKRNDPLPAPVITPTTKALAGQHDEQLTRDQVVGRGLVDAALWRQVESAAFALFARGRLLAQRAGLILVDTKYEFGLVDGALALIDEVHTPDSSRYWLADSVPAANAGGGEPESYDKEYLRRWLIDRGYRGDGDPPALDPEFVVELAGRYIDVYERLTGAAFVPAAQPAGPRIARALRDAGFDGRK